MSKIESKLYDRIYRYMTQSISVGGSAPTYEQVIVPCGSIRTLYSDPLYKSKIASGANATNPYTAQTRTNRWHGGRTTGYGVHPAVIGQIATNTFNGVLPYPLPMITSLPTTDEAINLAAIGLLKKINKRQEMVSGLTIIGEFRETVRMIRQPALALRQKTGLFCKGLLATRNQVKAWKRRDWHKVVADSWLEFVFGVQPLISDIRSITEALVDFRDTGIYPVRQVNNVKLNYRDRFSNGIGAGAVMDWDRSNTKETTVKWVAGVREVADYNKTAIERLHNRSGLDLNHVLPAAWEIVPFSFLVDYFTNIGDVLGGVCTSTRDVAWTSRTVVNVVSYEDINFRLTNTDPAWALYVLEKEPYQFAVSRHIERSAVLPSISLTSFRLDFPGFNTKWLNMGALAVQRNLFLKRK